jgi:uncharacterized caspase-like protein
MRKALVVGINDYPTAPLAGCVSDATSIGVILASHGDGSPNFDVKQMISPSEVVTRATLREAIDLLFSGDPEMALLYFSGHGHINGTGGYVVTTDAQKFDEGVSMDDILTLANKSKAKNKVIILDCCYSGAAGSPAISGGSLCQLSEGLSVLTASRGSESALEVNDSGVFTSLLLAALQGGAADIRGNITAGSLYVYADEALGAWDQRPIFKTNISSFAPIRKVSPKVPIEILREITTYFAKPESEYPLDPSYEFSDPSAVDEKVVVLKNLQKLESVGLVIPIDEEHMYFAAMNSKACRLTALGYQYWRLANENKL